MQHIGVEKIDENGKTLERSEINFADFMVELYNIEDYKSQFPMMAYVDPYGDTYLNLLQRPVFVEELQRFNFDKSVIEQVVKFIESAYIHEYIKFIGD